MPRKKGKGSGRSPKAVRRNQWEADRDASAFSRNTWEACRNS